MVSTDLLALIGKDTQLKRVASTGGGEYAGACPFCGGRDRFRVWPEHPRGGARWWCRRCGKHGDAIDFLREREGLTFRQALERLGAASPAGASPRPAATDRPAWDNKVALAVVQECEAALWASQGEKARTWLHHRGLRDDTLRSWRIGYHLSDQRLHGLFVPRGIVIPCFVDDMVWYIKVRRPVPPLPGPKYRQVAGGKAALFGLDHLGGHRTVVICEAELDALLLWQEAGDFVDVVALGSKVTRPPLTWLMRLVGATTWLLALDCDADDAAAWWGEFSARVRRVHVPQGNDITEFTQTGGDLRAWVEFHLNRGNALESRGKNDPLMKEAQFHPNRGNALDPLVEFAVCKLGAVCTT